MILLYRNHFYGPDQLDEAFGALALATGAVGAGLFLAALVTPWATRVLTLRRWITVLFVAAAVVTAFPGGLYTQPAILVAGFLTGFCAQGVKISVDTLVQTGVDDVYRGRVFSLYDMIFNVGQVSAAALGARDPARQREVLPGPRLRRARLPADCYSPIHAGPP